MAALAPNPSSSSFCFTLNTTLLNKNLYGPRVGTISLHRRPPVLDDSSSSTLLTLQTPTFITTTSRGVIPHLSRDNHHRTESIRWVNIPFETFLEHNPPVPTLHPDKDPLHTFLGFTPGEHIVSLSARDADDGREMPPNGNLALSVWTLRGVRKLSPSDWLSYTLKCQPDVVFALSDTPFTDPPYSQKRLTKGIERSAVWLSHLLRPLFGNLDSSNSYSHTTPSLHPNPDGDASSQSHSGIPFPRRPAVLVHMSGGTSIPARRAFSSSLLEVLHGPEAEAVKPLKSLNEGVVGYTFDLKPLRQAIEARERKERGLSTVGIVSATNRVNGNRNEKSNLEQDGTMSFLPAHTGSILPLMRASLDKLPKDKLRLVNSTEGPHEVLSYISEVGVDAFDAAWAQRAAGWGVGLDFEFPVRETEEEVKKKKEIGHNLYDHKYAFDFGAIADSFRGAFIQDGQGADGKVMSKPVCTCHACSPCSPTDQIYHGVDAPEHTLAKSDKGTLRPFYTRAYIHHLLHTHEMSAHSLLVMHNLTVLDRFFEGIRRVVNEIASSAEVEASMRWANEVKRFNEVYEDMGSEFFERARMNWKDVDYARGKGRLAREKGKEREEEKDKAGEQEKSLGSDVVDGVLKCGVIEKK